MSSNVGRVYMACWSSAPSQLLLVVREDHAVHLMNLETGELYEWIPSDLKARTRKLRMRRIA